MVPRDARESGGAIGGKGNAGAGGSSTALASRRRPAPMFQDFRIEKFRCFESLKLEGLERVNLIVGANNSGKTALLEAWQWLCQPGRLGRRASSSPRDLFPVLRSTDRFSDSAGTTLGWLFHRGDVARPIELRAREAASGTEVASHFVATRVRHDVPGMPADAMLRRQEKAWVLEIKLHRPGDIGDTPHTWTFDIDDESDASLPGPVPLACVSAGAPRRNLAQLARWYSNADSEGRHDDVVAVLRRVDPRLNRLSVTVDRDDAILQADMGLGHLIPVSYLGDGFLRLLVLAVKLVAARTGVLLIDELESSFHRDALDRVWEYLRDASRELDVQVFATTHSWEAIQSAHEVFSQGDSYDFAIHRLARKGDAITASRLGRDAIAAALKTGLDIR